MTAPTKEELRKLLELAAKAAEIDGEVETYTWNAAHWGRPESESKTSMFIRTGPTEAWNPLTNDGDALRLAVKLNLSVYVWDNYISVTQAMTPFTELEIVEDEFDDKYAATRLAVLCAAAAIGEAMP